MASFLASQSVRLYNMKHQSGFSFLIPYSLFLILLSSCSATRYISREAKSDILSDSNFTSAHVGISIYDPSANKYLYNYQGDKYFIPASNTKLFTCYAAMKHLGDSLVGLKYFESDSVMIIQGTGDPSFLHPDFKNHPVLDFLSQRKNKIILFNTPRFPTKPMGFGWAWDDYLSDYMVERSYFPIYGNVVDFYIKNDTFDTYPRYFKQLAHYNPEIQKLQGLKVNRPKESNEFLVDEGNQKRITVPFSTPGSMLQALLLDDTLHARLLKYGFNAENVAVKKLHSQPTDSLLKPMMHRSDNFFAEQTLLMVSNEMTGVMNDAKIIDSLLKTDYKDLPQKPRWVDGSGLSRYNLFSPQDIVTVLNKMKTDFSWNRITTILATGGEGTLSSYYINFKDRIFAKTGTLSNNIALSGFLITRQNKTLIFSVLVNNHMGNTTQIRKAVEKFLTAVTNKY
jgi:serine-type D-Ala-D-Ala carboxypeptidase/endopeptidase (penicillin-binding protein 4)